MRDFRGLHGWQKAHQLTLDVYTATAGFPREEIFGETAQIRRACASIPANIAEGCGRDGPAELNRFFRIAMGSASELGYHLMLVRDLQMLDPDSADRLLANVVEVKRMLGSYIQRIKSTPLRDLTSDI